MAVGDGSTAGPPAGGRGWRPAVAWLCFGLAMLTVLVSSLTVWVRAQVMDTDSWVRTSSELLADDEVRGALSLYLVDELYANVDVAAEIRRVLPDEVKPLSAPIAGALRDVSVRVADEVLASPRVQALWERVNRRAHELFTAVIDEEPVGPFLARESEVVLDVRPLIMQLRQRLGVQGVVAPEVGRIVVLESDEIGRVRTAVRAFTAISLLVGLVVIALLAAAVWLARDRRAMLLWSGVGLVAIGIALLIARRLAGDAVMDALVETASIEPAGRSAWVISTSLLRGVAVGLIAYGVVAMAGAALAGPSRPAAWLRGHLVPVFRRPAWTHVGLGLVLMLGLLVGPGTGGRSLIASFALAALLVVGVEVLRRRTLAEFPAPAPDPG